MAIAGGVCGDTVWIGGAVIATMPRDIWFALYRVEDTGYSISSSPGFISICSLCFLQFRESALYSGDNALLQSHEVIHRVYCDDQC